MRYFKKLGSLKITFFLLIILAVVSALGTFIIQQEKKDFYLQRYGEFFGTWIIVLGIDDLFNSVWYVGILVLFGLNLAICAFGSLKLRIFRNQKQFALFLLHISVLLIFIGAAFSKSTRISEYKQLLPNESIRLDKTDTEILFKQFYIDFYPGTNQPSGYRSEIVLLKDVGQSENKIVKVNHPIKVKDFTLYQSGFEIFADVQISLTHAGKVIWEGKLKHDVPTDIPNSGISLAIEHFMPDALILEDGTITLNSYNLNNPALLINIFRQNELMQQQWVFAEEEVSRQYQSTPSLFMFEIKKITPIYATIFQIVKDPGVKVIWLGFLILSLGLFSILFYKRN